MGELSIHQYLPTVYNHNAPWNKAQQWSSRRGSTSIINAVLYRWLVNMVITSRLRLLYRSFCTTPGLDKLFQRMFHHVGFQNFHVRGSVDWCRESAHPAFGNLFDVSHFHECVNAVGKNAWHIHLKTIVALQRLAGSSIHKGADY